jgi:hypothetical protein
MTTYKLYGSTRPGARVDRVKLDGTVLERGGDAVELSEEQVEDLRGRGIDIREEESGSEATQPEVQEAEAQDVSEEPRNQGDKS